MMQFLRMVLNIIPKHRPTMANCVDFFSRKIAFYIADKSSLKISYGLKEVKEQVHKTKDWSIDTGHRGKDDASSTTSSSSLPSMIDVVQQQSFHTNPRTKHDQGAVRTARPRGEVLP
jgi:hypothetical protein